MIQGRGKPPAFPFMGALTRRPCLPKAGTSITDMSPLVDQMRPIPFAAEVQQATRSRDERAEVTSPSGTGPPTPPEETMAVR